MIKVSILKNGTLTHAGEFPTQDEAQAWLSKHEGMGTFGQKAGTREVQVEIVPAVINEDGTEAAPALYETQTEEIPGYVVVIEDLTAKLEQDRVNSEALAFLQSSDWIVIRNQETGLAIPQEILTARAEARAKIVK